MGHETTSYRAKPKHRKGLWSPEEDQRLRNYILNHGHGCWSSLPLKAGLERNGKSCRLRWMNYLRPGLKRGTFSQQEEDTVLALHHILGNKWSQIAQHLPGRTDNEVKNLWHSYLKKKLNKTNPKSAQKNPTISTTNSTNSESPSIQSSNSTHSMDSPICPLPRLFFAEWLAADNGGAGIGFCQSLGSDCQDGAVYGGQPTAVINSDHDVKFEDQISNGLVNYASAGDDVCVELLHFGNNFMYI